MEPNPCRYCGTIADEVQRDDVNFWCCDTSELVNLRFRLTHAEQRLNDRADRIEEEKKRLSDFAASFEARLDEVALSFEVRLDKAILRTEAAEKVVEVARKFHRCRKDCAMRCEICDELDVYDKVLKGE